MHNCFHKNTKHNCFQLIILEMFLKHQISILEWFLRDHVTDHVTGALMLKIQLCHHKNQLHFKIQVYKYFTILLFTVFLIKWMLSLWVSRTSNHKSRTMVLCHVPALHPWLCFLHKTRLIHEIIGRTGSNFDQLIKYQQLSPIRRSVSQSNLPVVHVKWAAGSVMCSPAVMLSGCSLVRSPGKVNWT